MSQYDLNLLDCTLRDGGYVNDWKWGFQKAHDIILSLIRAEIDVVEVGFLRNIDRYNPDICVCNTIEELNSLLPEQCGHTMFSCMAMCSNYDVRKLSPYSGKGIEMVRITAHDYDIEDGLEFAREVKEKGYKVSVNPINIMGYTDSNILRILEKVNQIQPYQFSIVDTFGSMKRRDMDRIVSLVDNNLDQNIRVALHLHENMSLSCCLSQDFVEKHLNRPVAIDGSLMGMGRIPGNLPVELIADYLNEYADKSYNIDYLMDAIQDYIAPLRGASYWGYTPAFFLSARYNLHRNYAEYYLGKGDLTNKDINHILARFNPSKKTVFDEVYANTVYEDYMSHRIDDSEDRKKLQKELSHKKILVIAPGESISTHYDTICNYIEIEEPIVIGVNFIPDNYEVNYAFFSNNRRYSKLESFPCKTIVTSNLIDGEADYRIDYNSVSGAFKQGCNSLILLLKLLKEMEVESISMAGADGYIENRFGYYKSNMKSYTEHDNKFNVAVADAIRKLNISINFLTPSGYDIYQKNRARANEMSEKSGGVQR